MCKNCHNWSKCAIFDSIMQILVQMGNFLSNLFKFFTIVQFFVYIMWKKYLNWCNFYYKCVIFGTIGAFFFQFWSRLCKNWLNCCKFTNFKRIVAYFCAIVQILIQQHIFFYNCAIFDLHYMQNLFQSGKYSNFDASI